MPRKLVLPLQAQTNSRLSRILRIEGAPVNLQGVGPLRERFCSNANWQKIFWNCEFSAERYQNRYFKLIILSRLYFEFDHLSELVEMAFKAEHHLVKAHKLFLSHAKYSWIGYCGNGNYAAPTSGSTPPANPKQCRQTFDTDIVTTIRVFISRSYKPCFCRPANAFGQC